MAESNILFLDNTLREGEQVPGVVFTSNEKRELFQQLQNIGVDLLDIGIPATSKQDLEFCKECIEQAHTAIPGVSIRSTPEELELAASIKAPEIYLMFPFSEIHLERKFNLTLEDVKANMTLMLREARRHQIEVNLVAEDASRGSMNLLEDLIQHARQEGIKRLFICDTVGTSYPRIFEQSIREVVSWVGREIEVGAHCHNDFGLATANTLAAVEAGASIVSVTLNGLGERTGNAPLHEVALALTQLLHCEHRINLSQLTALSQLAERYSGVFLSPMEPGVGRNSFRHESGIHVDGLLKDPLVYESLKPETLGRSRCLVFGKTSGRHHLQSFLEQHRIEIDPQSLQELHQWLQQQWSPFQKESFEHMQQQLKSFYDHHLEMTTEQLLQLINQWMSDR